MSTRASAVSLTIRAPRPFDSTADSWQLTVPAAAIPFGRSCPAPRVELLTRPVQRFLEIQSASGIVLIIFTLAALLLANSRWAEPIAHFWHTPCEIRFGQWMLQKDLLHLINDGLMVVFFFLVGLEIKREIVAGELRDPGRRPCQLWRPSGG